MWMINYAALIVLGALGMSILDQDHAHVSIEEWAIYGVMLFSAWKLVQEMVQYYKDHEGDF
jgi:predicted tellurium resistance membrane protein TerC